MGNDFTPNIITASVSGPFALAVSKLGVSPSQLAL
jgi:hypothetical protein